MCLVHAPSALNSSKTVEANFLHLHFDFLPKYNKSPFLAISEKDDIVSKNVNFGIKKKKLKIAFYLL